MTKGKRKVAVVGGGAGFLGSHLCDLLLGDSYEVICIDSFRTGRRQNLRHLEHEPRFDLIEADIIELRPGEPGAPATVIDFPGNYDDYLAGRTAERAAA